VSFYLGLFKWRKTLDPVVRLGFKGLIATILMAIKIVRIAV